nr:OTU domain-containing protein 3 isoform X3 [Ipomoea batatas]
MRTSTRNTGVWLCNTSGRIVKCLSHLLKMRYHLMNIVNPWKRMVHGQDIWNCKLLLLLLTVTFASTDICFLAGTYEILTIVKLR